MLCYCDTNIRLRKTAGRATELEDTLAKQTDEIARALQEKDAQTQALLTEVRPGV